MRSLYLEFPSLLSFISASYSDQPAVWSPQISQPSIGGPHETPAV